MDGFLLNKFDAEAHRISNILNIWDFGFLVGALKRFAHEEPHHRMQLVLRDYFKQSDMNVPQSALENDASTIKSIFPDCSMEEITRQLREIGNEENRVRIVVKRLLRLNGNNYLKRASPNLAEGNDAVASKRSKLASATVVSGEGSQDGANEDSCIAEEAVATLAQTQQSADSESTIIDSSSYVSQEVFVEKIETNLPHSPQLEQNGQHDNKHTEVDQILNLLIEEIDTTDRNMLSIAVTETNSVTQKVEVDTQFCSSLYGDLAQKSEDAHTTGNSNNYLGSSAVVDEVILENLLPSTSGATDSKMVVQDAVTSTSNSSGGASATFNLYKHLKEMFTNIPKKDIKAVCAAYNANKLEKPCDNRLNAIITELLSMNPWSPGVVKHNSDKLSSNDVTTSRNIVRIVKQGNTHVASIEDVGTNPITTKVPEVPQDDVNEVNGAPMSTQQKDLEMIRNTVSEMKANLQATLASLAVSDHPIDHFRVAPAATVVNQHQPTVSLNANFFQPTQQLVLANPPRFFGDRDEELNEILKDLGEQTSDDDVEEVSDTEEAVSNIEQAVTDNGLVYPLMEMFPEACPTFIRNMCMGKINAPGVLDDLISRILELDSYPKRQKAASPERQLNSEEQLEILKQVLPDADPSYLQIHCDRLIDKPNELKLFIEQAVEHHNYPTMKDYLRKQQLSAQQKQYTTEFSIEKFLEVIPNPTEYFKDSKRKPAKIDLDSQHYALCFMRNHFNKLPLRNIREVFRKNKENFLLTCNALETVSKSEYLKSKRYAASMPSAIQNIPLLQEIAYYEHRGEIETFLQLQKEKQDNERKAAKQAGLLQTCSCCYDEEVMPKDIYMCENGCAFCKDCVRRGAEVAFGDGKLDFACLNNCSSHFSLQTLQAVLEPKMFSKVALKKQLEEVRAAGIEDLEMCPFCDFATIPAREDKLFRCFNPECMKESCRLCKEPSHVPLRCDEVEKDDDVKRRTYIENKMTEALLRKCYKCGMKFIKADGCNKMTCSCGALMCYVCGQPVKDYKHFNGPGGDKTNLCPLYSDTNQLHQEAVLKGASEAKQEIGITDPAQLKIDPTADIQQHYQQIAKKNPPPPYAQVMHIDPFRNLDPGLQQMQERYLQRLEEVRNHHRQHRQQVRALQQIEEVRNEHLQQQQQRLQENERALQRLGEIRRHHRQHRQQHNRNRHMYEHHHHHHQHHQH